MQLHQNDGSGWGMRMTSAMDQRHSGCFLVDQEGKVVSLSVAVPCWVRCWNTPRPSMKRSLPSPGGRGRRRTESSQREVVKPPQWSLRW